MKQGQFQYRYHWLLGLDEYYQWSEVYHEKYQIFLKALYHDNWYRKRDVLLEFILKSDRITNYADARYWVNVLLREHLDINEVKPEFIVGMVHNYMGNEPFLNRLKQFVYSYLPEEQSEWSDNVAINIPDIGDFLSRGQIKSKLWLITELAKVVDGPLGSVVFYGGWHNFIAHMIMEQFETHHVTTIDLDEDCQRRLGYMYGNEMEAGKFEAVTGDVTHIQWNDNSTFVLDGITRAANIVINTSCEHMDNTWFENLPAGTFVLLQQNDYFSNPQHINCCNDLDDVIHKYPMQNIFYSGELDTDLYKRFMLIGIK